MSNNERLKHFERQISSEISLLCLDKIGLEWTNLVISNDFLHFEDLPISYEEILEECNIIARMKNMQKICFKWLEENKKLNPASECLATTLENSELGDGPLNSVQATNNGSSFWSFLLQEEKLDLQPLIALIGFLIDKGSVLSSCPEDQEKCFAAANLYLVLVCVPGSMAFRVYHQMLYLKTLQLNQLFTQANKNRQNVVGSKKNQSSKNMSINEFDGEEEGHHLSDKEIAAIEKKMDIFLDCLSLVAQKLSFKRYPGILKETIESMLPLISLAAGSVSVKALETIQCFCNPLHGDADQTVHYVFLHNLSYLALDPNEKDLNVK